MAGTVARVSEISARSDTSFEDAVNTGLDSGQHHAAWCQVGLDKGAVGGRGEREDCRLPRQHAGHLRPRVAGSLGPKKGSASVTAARFSSASRCSADHSDRL